MCCKATDSENRQKHNKVFKKLNLISVSNGLIEQHIRVIKLYTENVGLRSIERLEGIPAPLLVRWIRSFGKVLREKLCTTEVPQDAKDIVILELDELYTYYQKKVKEPTYGLLWTATGIKLLIL